ncbi:uncharacterized protein LOC131651275 [Vicia villosa]|uniref:uncharacterized protein LOC131651275 n=1 Tax=Vicia villosa TaxID=3911 RepID=UPI00273C91FC|nr:uncharacterized protein LOC131651275 [Vicia villosa]
MARANSTLPISFFEIILQTNLKTIKILNKFTRSHGAGLPNPVMMKPPDGTKWKVFWKNINGEIWFQKGWNTFTKNYSLQYGCLVVFKYKEGSVDDESIEILNERLNKKKATHKLPLVSPRRHKKVIGEIKETSGRTTSLNCPRENSAQESFVLLHVSLLHEPPHLGANCLNVSAISGVSTGGHDDPSPSAILGTSVLEENVGDKGTNYMEENMGDEGTNDMEENMGDEGTTEMEVNLGDEETTEMEVNLGDKWTIEGINCNQEDIEEFTIAKEIWKLRVLMRD